MRFWMGAVREKPRLESPTTWISFPFPFPHLIYEIFVEKCVPFSPSLSFFLSFFLSFLSSRQFQNKKRRLISHNSWPSLLPRYCIRFREFGFNSGIVRTGPVMSKRALLQILFCGAFFSLGAAAAGFLSLASIHPIRSDLEFVGKVPIQLTSSVLYLTWTETGLDSCIHIFMYSFQCFILCSDDSICRFPC